MDKKVAVIDLGTNTFHMLFAEWDGSQYNIYFRERLPVKIGMGGINDNRITDSGLTRALEALQQFKKTLKSEGITSVHAIGTSAFRNAENGEEAVKRIQGETGIAVNVISGEEEANYIYHGVRKAVNLGIAVSLIVDIGGGSVEFIIANANQIFWKRSFEIGAQRLLERFQKHDPILPSEVKELNEYFEVALSPLLEACRNFNPTILVGSSGTFDTLSDIYCIRHDIRPADHAPETPLTFKRFEEIHRELLIKNRAQRLAIPGMLEMRVDMIVVASCLIKFLVDTLSLDAVRVSSYSLKEGVLSMLEKQSLA